MRDGEIYHGLASMNKRVALIYRQMVFIDTRIQSFEAVFSQPWAILKFLISPRAMFKRVDSLHLELMRNHDENMRQRAAEEAKPKISIVSAGSINGR
jgi:hypothetical protein